MSVVKTAREKARLSQRGLERKSGVKQSLIAQVEKKTAGPQSGRGIEAGGAVKGTVRTSTFERHEQIIRAHLAPVIGRVKLKTLTPAHVRSLHREKLEE